MALEVIVRVDLRAGSLVAGEDAGARFLAGGTLSSARSKAAMSQSAKLVLADGLGLDRIEIGGRPSRDRRDRHDGADRVASGARVPEAGGAVDRRPGGPQHGDGRRQPFCAIPLWRFRRRPARPRRRGLERGCRRTARRVDLESFLAGREAMNRRIVRRVRLRASSRWQPSASPRSCAGSRTGPRSCRLRRCCPRRGGRSPVPASPMAPWRRGRSARTAVGSGARRPAARRRCDRGGGRGRAEGCAPQSDPAGERLVPARRAAGPSAAAAFGLQGAAMAQDSRHLHGQRRRTGRVRRARRPSRRRAARQARPHRAPRSAAGRAPAAPAPCMVDGELTLSCLVPATGCEGAAVDTLEGHRRQRRARIRSSAPSPTASPPNAASARPA